MTDREFAKFFAMAQALPGPNMILMMSFIGWKVWGFPGAVARACATFGPPCVIYFGAYRDLASLPQRGRGNQSCDVVSCR